MTKTETLKLTELTMDMKYIKEEQEAQRKKLDATHDAVLRLPELAPILTNLADM